MNWTLTPAGSLMKKKRTDDMGETYVSKGAKPLLTFWRNTLMTFDKAAPLLLDTKSAGICPTHWEAPASGASSRCQYPVSGGFLQQRTVDSRKTSHMNPCVTMGW